MLGCTSGGAYVAYIYLLTRMTGGRYRRLIRFLLVVLMWRPSSADELLLLGGLRFDIIRFLFSFIERFDPGD